MDAPEGRAEEGRDLLLDSFTPTVFRSRIFFADAADCGTLTFTDEDGEAVTVCTRLRDVPPRLPDAFGHDRGDA